MSEEERSQTLSSYILDRSIRSLLWFIAITLIHVRRARDSSEVFVPRLDEVGGEEEEEGKKEKEKEKKE